LVCDRRRRGLSFAPLWGRNLRRTPLHTYGMVIAHFGIARRARRHGCESAFTVERLVAASVGETGPVGPMAGEASPA
jgi:cytochrome c-type biogenesis protein CcmF